MAYKVPFVDYPRHYKSLEKEILKIFNEIVFGGDFILRQQLKTFEQNIADFIGTKHAIGVSSGTDALILSLKAAGIGSGDEVITVAHTFVATIASIVHCGATPILIDIADDYNMDIDLLEDAITEKTRAIIPVHLNGRICDMPELMAICNRYNLVVVEDAAQSLGATVAGKNSGSLGLASCFSFYPAKILGCTGDGGLVATSDDDMAAQIRLLRDHGLDRTSGDILRYGFTNRLDNLQAAILDLKLGYLPRWIERRRELAAIYEQGLSQLSEIKTPPAPESDGNHFDVFQNYVVRAKNRNQLVTFLRQRSIETMVSNAKPVHHHPALGLSHFHLPRTEQFAREVVSLPLNTELSNRQVEFVIESIHDFYKDNRR